MPPQFEAVPDKLKHAQCSSSTITKIPPASPATAISAAFSASTLNSMSAIPAKFRAPAQNLQRRSRPVVPPPSHSNGFATSKISVEARSQHLSTTTPVQTGHETPAPAEDLLPDLPTWFIHAFAGFATFVLIVAVVLYLAQFPPRLSWIKNLKRRYHGYTKVHQDDYELDQLYHRGRSSAVASTHHDFEHDSESENKATVRRRKPRHLRINTVAEYHGLGIAVPGEEDAGSQSGNRRPFDEEALRQRPKSPAVATWEALTAPLPSVTAFVHGQNTLTPFSTPPVYAEQADVESGRRPLRQVGASTPDMFDVTSPYHHRPRGADEDAPGSAFLKKVNGRVNYAADRLSRTLHDQVMGPEEGLLLPVRNGEREQPYTPGVYVG